jgi:ubiquinone/menaquinone biosynthesis C-methylase UbiE
MERRIKNNHLEKLLSETIRGYDKIAPLYKNDCRGRIDEDQLYHLQKFVKLLGPPPKKILDAGCGTGKDISYFSSLGYEVIGIDLSEGMLKEAKETLKNRPNVCLIRGDFRTTGFPDNYFDGIWSSASLVHLPQNEKKRALIEFNRILKEDGILCVGIQNLLNFGRLLRIIKSYIATRKIPILHGIEIGYAYYDERHWFFPTRYELEKLINESGYKVVDICGNLFSNRLRIYAKKYKSD